MFSEFICGLKFMFKPRAVVRKECAKKSHGHFGYVVATVVAALISFVSPYQKSIADKMEYSQALVWFAVCMLIYLLVLGLVLPYFMHAVIRLMSKGTSLTVGRLRFILSSALLPVAIVLFVSTFFTAGMDIKRISYTFFKINISIWLVVSLWSLVILTVALMEYMSTLSSFVTALFSAILATLFTSTLLSLIDSPYAFMQANEISEVHNDEQSNKEYIVYEDSVKEESAV